jgi:hypothetical protein
MVRYLSAAWFDRIRGDAAGAIAPADGAPSGPDALPLVLRHVVRAAPGSGPDRTGDTGYDVVIAGGRAVIRHPVSGPADLTFTCDYPTAAAVAAGRLSTHAALAEGRLRVAGDVGILARRAAEVAGVDPLPAGLRAETEF